MQHVPTAREVPDWSHDDQVLAALRQLGPLTRAELVDHVGLSRTTISQVVGDLLRAGVIHATRETSPDGPGRPVERIYLDPSTGHILGIDLGRRQAHVIVANAAHEKVLSSAVQYASGATWTERLIATLNHVSMVAGRIGVSLATPHAVGLGLPGPVTTTWRQDGSPDHQAPPVMLHELAQFAERHVEQTYGASVTINNNIRFAGLAEAIWGAGRGSTEQLFVRISLGMGGSLISNGETVVGSAGLGGEIGHITVDPYGPDCRCGKRGCVEALAAAPALIARCRVSSLAELCQAWRDGVPAVRNAVGQAADHVGLAVAAVVMAANPSVVVVGGDLVEGIPEFTSLMENAMREHVIPAMRDFVAVHAARLGPEAGALGAIAAALKRVPGHASQ